MDALRACAIQMAHGDDFHANLAHARGLLERAADAGARLALLPEYFWAPRGGPHGVVGEMRHARRMLEAASRDLRIAVSGNVLEPREGGLQNVGLVYDAGRLVLEQPKIHPMPREAAAGVGAGARLDVATVAGHGVGVLVCADILYPEAARILALKGAQVLLNPVMSPYRERDDTKEARDALFVARAYDAGAFVLKAGGFRRPAGGAPGAVDAAAPPPAVAGRSLVAAPWGIVARYRDDFAEELVLADLDFARLQAFREHQRSFPARRPEAYRDLL